MLPLGNSRQRRRPQGFARSDAIAAEVHVALSVPINGLMLKRFGDQRFERVAFFLQGANLLRQFNEPFQRLGAVECT